MAVIVQKPDSFIIPSIGSVWLANPSVNPTIENIGDYGVPNTSDPEDKLLNLYDQIYYKSVTGNYFHLNGRYLELIFGDSGNVYDDNGNHVTNSSITNGIYIKYNNYYEPILKESRYNKYDQSSITNGDIMMDNLGDNVFYININKTKLKNEYLKYFMISIYDEEEISEHTNGGQFSGWISLGTPIYLGDIKKIKIIFTINNNYVYAELYTELIDEFKSHSLDNYYTAHDSANNNSSNVVHNNLPGVFNQFKTYSNYLLTNQYYMKYMDRSNIHNGDYNDYKTNGDISLCKSNSNNDIVKTVNNYKYLRGLKVDYDLQLMLNHTDTDVWRNTGYNNGKGIMPNEFPSCGTEVNLFRYSYLTCCHPLGLVPYTFVPLNVDEYGNWLEYYIVIGGSDNCKFNRLYYIKDLIIDNSIFSSYMKPFVYYYLDSLVILYKGDLYLIVPNKCELSVSNGGAEDSRDDLLRTHYYFTNIIKLNDSKYHLLIPEYYDLLRYAYHFEDTNYGIPDIGACNYVNNSFTSIIYSGKDLGNLTYSNFRNDSDKYLVDEDDSINQWNVLNSFMAGYIHLYRLINIFDKKYLYFLAYDNFLLESDNDKLYYYPYSYKVNNGEKIELPKTKFISVDDDQISIELSKIESSGNMIVLHYNYDPYDYIDYIYFGEGLRNNKINIIKSDKVNINNEKSINYRGINLKINNNQVTVEV